MLVQENADLKLLIMRKVMVESKKEEMARLSSSLTFLKETEISILDK